MTIHPLLMMLGAGVVLFILTWATMHHLSRDARLGRRRRRNSHRLESKVKRPMVRLSVRTRRRK